ncbi:uncharacterized protein MELLADRAFT_91878 [Melampsora larici-populina 98AG31]|uniref:Uncharacterized protein n=1 Tax=Melampsora larici-populina (strain 98AG31 / pathotype 3-4-7) TaxID=747676 RepID=F4S0P7_MELLP|nr:uncharacterized protein MELLADRAFT_91878 [Melampsora larici-populina 98AG31]EGG01827.1 hypothetical protein MELLADRAFT_91878 [Melampsora larici-populina 98AG31]
MLTMKKNDERNPVQSEKQTGDHYNQMDGHDVHLSKLGGSQDEFLTYVARNLVDAASKYSLVDPVINEKTFTASRRRKSAPHNRISSTTNELPLTNLGTQTLENRSSHMPSNSSSIRIPTHCSCRSVSKTNSRPTSASSSSRRLSIYFLPSESLDLERLTSHDQSDMPRYISRSPVSDSDLEYFSFPPSSQSHHQNDECINQLQDEQESPASCSTAVGQLEILSEDDEKEVSLEFKSCKGNYSLYDSAKSSAQHYVQLGIKAHEDDNLKRSASLFRRSATEAGGCGLGMLMWALSLRHGWGCEVDTMKAYWWLRLSAETFVNDLNALKSEMTHMDLLLAVDESVNLGQSQEHRTSIERLLKECRAIISELLLALYELGQCLMMGWGCPKDKKLAVQYYTLAAKLGDPDAQLELGFCYETGKGVEKSSRQAAKYYRMASIQGVQMMGYQWIWKDKALKCIPPNHQYDPPDRT